jgi:hypothetical protein
MEETMVNYYSQFHTLKSSLGTHTLRLDDFKLALMRFYGFGLDRTIRKWLYNFEHAGFIRIYKDKMSDVWMVELL